MSEEEEEDDLGFTPQIGGKAHNKAIFIYFSVFIQAQRRRKEIEQMKLEKESFAFIIALFYFLRFVFLYLSSIQTFGLFVQEPGKMTQRLLYVFIPFETIRPF